ncbi:Lcl C-terminal domain-containing protein [Tenuifilum thalassicum]|uniref:DUF1566 domain-containing protein n=1 Tax=Tenuifilum thalassicum TaxID=2590900 RepID=A0A7D3XZH6_9BACT|nr:DUF1566 domain-containing protein [Tenuifilum thalassicum]QKG79873.1 DUF1566 domain-containing protein [Tenuifilum thalassicum]
MTKRANKILYPIYGLAAILITACNPSGSSDDQDEQIEINTKYGIVETGQVSCYNTNGEEIPSPNPGDYLYGQDGNYRKGNSFAFIDNGDGTVTDVNTGLMWQQIPTTKDLTWEEANAYCDSLTLAGYDDWRLPTAKELFSIWNGSQGWPYIDNTYFKLVYELTGDSINKDEQYWTSTKYVGTTVEGGNNAAFGVNFATGHIKAYPAGSQTPQPNGAMALQQPMPMMQTGQSQMNDSTPPPPPGPGSPFGKYVRCVRGKVYGENQFVNNDDGTITDMATGLMWTKVDFGPLDWPSALKLADTSTYAGYSDWRLPNVKELHSIVDYTRSPSATDEDKIGPSINPLFSCTQIINEAGEVDYPYYWSSTSAKMHAGEPMYYAWYVAFGRAIDPNGDDIHGAGAIRFDTKVQEGPAGEGGERIFNYVRLVRDAK